MNSTRIWFFWYCLWLLPSNASGATSNCNEENFSNHYYLINIEEFSKAAHFFQQLSEGSFKSLEGFSNITGKQRRNVAYFDFKNFSLLKAGHELFLTEFDNIPSYRKDKKSITHIKPDGQSSNRIDYRVKDYSRLITGTDRHALLGLVQRKKRPQLIAHLNALSGNNNPLSLTTTLNISIDDIVYRTSHYGIAQAQVTLSNISIYNFGIPKTHAMLAFEYLQGKESTLKKKEMELLKKTYCLTRKKFEKQLPKAKHFQNVTYADYIDLANRDLPFRGYFKMYPLLFTVGQILTLSFICFLVLYLQLNRKASLIAKKPAFVKITKPLKQ